MNCYSRGMFTVRLDLRERDLRSLALWLSLTNVAFVAGMIAFIHYWDHFDHYGPRGRMLIRHVLIQFHLGTENVIAAWYSSMLLLAVALAAGLVYALERRQPRAGVDRWLSGGWLVFATVFTLLSLDELGSFHERIGMMVALNKASLAPASTTPVGWVVMLAVPIAVVAAFMLAFAWLRLRRAPVAFALIVAGVLLYLSDPALELLEGTLVKNGGAKLILERILEEAVAELGGTMCFLFGVLLHAIRTEGAPPWTFTIPRRSAARIAAAAGVLLTAGVPLAHWFVDRLPGGDSGVPDNWFPAAALGLLAVMLAGGYGRAARVPAALAVALSAYFGAGIFVHTALFRAIGYRGALVDTIATAATALAAIGIALRAQESNLPLGAPSLER